MAIDTLEVAVISFVRSWKRNRTIVRIETTTTEMATTTGVKTKTTITLIATATTRIMLKRPWKRPMQ
eukprot:3544410-Ditylum_brightwellii.AAC.1